MTPDHAMLPTTPMERHGALVRIVMVAAGVMFAVAFCERFYSPSLRTAGASRGEDCAGTRTTARSREFNPAPDATLAQG